MTTRSVGITTLTALIATLGLLYVLAGLFALLSGATNAIGGTVWQGALGLIVGVIHLAAAWGLWRGAAWAFWVTMTASALNFVSALAQLWGGTADWATYASLVIAVIIMLWLFAAARMGFGQGGVSQS